MPKALYIKHKAKQKIYNPWQTHYSEELPFMFFISSFLKSSSALLIKANFLIGNTF